MFGVDWNGPIPLDGEVNIVDIPTTDCPLSDAQ